MYSAYAPTTESYTSATWVHLQTGICGARTFRPLRVSSVVVPRIWLSVSCSVVSADAISTDIEALVLLCGPAETPRSPASRSRTLASAATSWSSGRFR